MSSQFAHYCPASNCNDGITQPPLVSEYTYIAETQNEPNPWWQVDLEMNYLVYAVDFHNRHHCCKFTHLNYKLWVILKQKNKHNNDLLFVVNLLCLKPSCYNIIIATWCGSILIILLFQFPKPYQLLDLP